MKKIVLITSLFLTTNLVIANNCTETEIARMITRGLSDKVIDSVCAEDRNNKDNQKPTNKEDKKINKKAIKPLEKKSIKPSEVGKDRKEAFFSSLDDIKKDSPAYWRKEESSGLGFGYVGSGLDVYFDYSFDDEIQLHFFVSTSSDTAQSLFGTNIFQTTSSVVGSKVRYLISKEYGFFAGAGAGSHSVSQKTEQSIYCSSLFTSSDPSECSGHRDLPFLKKLNLLTQV